MKNKIYLFALSILLVGVGFVYTRASSNSQVFISNSSANYTLMTGGANGDTTGAAVTFVFTVTNTGNSDVYISKVPGIALGTSTTGSIGSPATGSSTLTYVTSSPSTYASDTGIVPTSGAYIIPAGTSRVLTYSGWLDNTNGTVGIRVFRITQINYGFSSNSVTSDFIDSDLEDLVVVPILSGGSSQPTINKYATCVDTPLYRTIQLDDSGSDVASLQNFLIKTGFLGSDFSFANIGYFGSSTLVAVINYQNSKTISPAEGTVGPITRATISAECNSVYGSNNTNLNIGEKSATYEYTPSGSDEQIYSAAMTFQFVLINNTGKDAYISKIPSRSVNTSVVVGDDPKLSSRLTYVTVLPGVLASDTGTAPVDGEYVIPAGSSRKFTYTGVIDNSLGSTDGLKVIKLDNITYSFTRGGSDLHITQDLDELTLSMNLKAGGNTVVVPNNPPPTIDTVDSSRVLTNQRALEPNTVSVTRPKNVEVLKEGSKYKITWSNKGLNVPRASTIRVYVIHGDEELYSVPSKMVASGLKYNATSYTWLVEPDNGNNGYAVGFIDNVWTMFGVQKAFADDDTYRVLIEYYGPSGIFAKGLSEPFKIQRKVLPPTASIKVNNQKRITLHPGDNALYEWSSTNADTWSSKYTSSCKGKTTKGEWSANTESGNRNDLINDSQIGCKYTITYTASNRETKKSDSDSITVVINKSGAVSTAASIFASIFNWIYRF